jgi:UDP-N-acetylmuramoylalanine--D-glutamate ligase
VSLDVRGMTVAVVGLASSGLAAARVLLGKGARVLVTEARSLDEVTDAAAEARAAGAELLAGGHAPRHLDGVDLVVTSPGVPEDAEILRWAGERRIPIWSELELGARMAQVPYVGVTGTNGKTTTTEMIGAAMRQAGVDAIACGNVGYPFSLAAAEGHQALVVEASSFQLRFHASFHPRVSTLLNLAPDHLDWHRSFESYRDAKRRIYLRQGADDVHVGNRDDPHAAAVSRDAPCRLIWFTLGRPGDDEVGYENGELVARIGGRHALGEPSPGSVSHRADAAAAAAAALAFGIDPEAVRAGIETFQPLPHRGTVVAEVEGVRFVDDSKASNPHAALAALDGFEGAVLVAGGRSKGIDLSPLAAATPQLAGVVVIGEAADELAELFEGRVPVRRATSMEEAVTEAHGMASPGGTVILAPACASWDMFRDYRERGDRFAEAARALADRQGVRRG